MSARHILGLEKVPKGLGCSPIKVARELGSERRETVRSLSIVGVGNLRALTLVREDRVGLTTGLPVVPPEHCRVAKSGLDKC